MKKVLVIGANSYVGKKFYEYVNLLNEKVMEVYMINASDGSWETVDFSQYDSVLHLSAIVHRKEKKSMKELYDRVNHRLPVKIACKAKESGVNQFVFMSTMSVYGKINGRITKETTTYPVTLYGQSKLDAEEALKKLENENFRIAILRAPMIYGEGCKGNYDKLRKLAAYMPVFPAYHNKRSWINIDRLSAYLLEVIMYMKQGCFFPQDNYYTDICELIINIRKQLGKKTYLVYTFNSLIDYLSRKSINIGKIFGDIYYDRNVLK